MLGSVLTCCFFFFKQKTAYEMRISDWSSDVCSSDLSAFFERAGRMADIEGICGRACQADPSRPPAHPRPSGTGTEPRRYHLFQLRRPGRDDGVDDSVELPRHGVGAGCRRSEEHTSELQSLMRISYAVFCLKKKK